MHSPEADLLIRMATPVLSVEDRQYCRELLAANLAELEWGFLLDQACRHRIVALVAKHLAAAWPDHHDPFAHPHMRLLNGYRQAVRQRNEALLRELERVLMELRDAGVRAALRKGPVLAYDLYQDISAREFGDVDLLVDRGDLDRARQRLSQLGFVEGTVRDFGRVVEPSSRKQRLYQAMQANAVHLIRPTGELFVDCHVIELTTNLFLPGSGLSVAAAELEAHFIPHTINGVPVEKLDPPAFLLDLCADIYLKATTLYWIEQGRDLQLSKLTDLSGLARTYDGRDVARQLVELADGFGVRHQVAYSLHLAAEVLGGGDRFGGFLDLFPFDGADLRRFGDSDAVLGVWDRPARERVFDSGRAASTPRSRYLSGIQSGPQ
jgi:hypothetical protein